MTDAILAQQALKDHFGYDAFRPGQQGVVEAILAGRDALAVMPTGAGKSVCYQVPGMVMEGLALVVSPLVSLMGDQVRALLDACLLYTSGLQVLKRVRLGYDEVGGLALLDRSRLLSQPQDARVAERGRVQRHLARRPHEALEVHHLAPHVVVRDVGARRIGAQARCV